MGRIFYLGVRKEDTILIWGYAEGYNFDLGVHEYQKVENPWFRPFLIIIVNNYDNTRRIKEFNIVEFNMSSAIK